MWLSVACTSVYNRTFRHMEEKTHWVNVVLTSVCCVQHPSSGISAVRKVRGARAQSTESRRRDKLLDTLTHFYNNAKDQRRQISTAAKHTWKSQFPYFSAQFAAAACTVPPWRRGTIVPAVAAVNKCTPWAIIQHNKDCPIKILWGVMCLFCMLYLVVTT